MPKIIAFGKAQEQNRSNIFANKARSTWVNTLVKSSQVKFKTALRKHIAVLLRDESADDAYFYCLGLVNNFA